MSSRKRIPQQILKYLVLVALSAVFMLPFFWMVRSSLLTLSQIFILPPIWVPRPAHFENYKNAMTLVPFGRYLGNTLLIAVTAILGMLFSSTISAFSFARIRWPRRNLVFGIILTSLMLPGAVTLIPQFIGWKSLGFYNTFAPLIVPAYFGGGAFNIFLLRQFLMTIPKELDEAAYVDGGTYFHIYWHVDMPLCRSAIIVVGLFAFMYHWNDFFGPLIYLEGEQKFTVALGLQQFQGNYNAQWELLMAASTVVILPAVVVFLLGQRYFIEGITLTGIKG